MKNPLSDIYSEKVLLQEAAKSNVVVKPSQQEIAKGGKVALAKSGGDEKVKKHVPKAKESKEYSDGGKAKKVSVKESELGGTFEKLFKATLNEDFGTSSAPNPFAPEVPTTNDEMADEIETTEDEASDLVSDLKSVMDHLQTILDKLSDETSEESGEESEEESENEIADEIEDELKEEAKEESDEDEEKVEEAVDAEEKGHALHNLKAGSELQKSSSKEVKGAVPVSKGKATGGDIDSDDKLKPAKSFDKSLQNTKGKPEVSSTIKAGDFFK